MESIILGGGCFWCLEALFVGVKGVSKVVSGYAGGDTPNPSYDAVCSRQTGHAEVVKIDFDPKIISLGLILKIFWSVHDPTTLNRQGHDHGTQYRSAVYFSQSQESVVKQAFDEANQAWGGKIVTELKIDQVFYEAEEYHQNYFASNPEKAYCQLVINPKLSKFRQEFEEYLV